MAVVGRANPTAHHVDEIAWHQNVDSIWNFTVTDQRVQPFCPLLCSIVDIVGSGVGCDARLANIHQHVMR